MHKSVVPLFLSVVGLLAVAPANATITRNGILYKEYGKTARCLDGSAKLSYQGKTWCPLYGVTLSWSAPVTRTNGKPLVASDLALYEIYWTREIDTRSGKLSKPRASESTQFYVFTPDTYHFAISAVDTSGLKSPLSKVVSIKLARK
jgi:hypothetical protein